MKTDDLIDGWDLFDAPLPPSFAENIEVAKRWLFNQDEWGKLTQRTPSFARVWLCYRLLDGALPLSDAEALISAPVPRITNSVERARWECSWHAVRSWMSALLDIEYSNLENMDREWILTQPTCVINVMRTRALQAIIRLRAGTLDESFLRESLALWRLGVAGISQWADILEHKLALDGMSVIIMACKQGGIINYHSWPLLHGSLQSMFSGSHYANKSWRKAALLAKWTDFISRVDLGLLVPDGGVVAELGVARGAFSAALLKQHRQIKRLHAIDRWNDERHPASEKAIAEKTLTDPRCSIMQASFEEAAVVFDNESFDMVYVDGYAHTGQEEGRTLTQWWPKVKQGGVIAGHDYDPAWPLTVQAVDSFAARHGLTVNEIHQHPYHSWWIRKPG